MDDITKWLRTKPNVVLVDTSGKAHKIVGGVDTGRPAITVGVTSKLPISALRIADIIPKMVDDKETDIIETGIIRALDNPYTGKFRPVPGGVSISHYEVTAGSGWWWKRHGEWVLCTNNHVGANENLCKIGDPWWQPGKVDGGTAADEIAKLLAWVHLYGFEPPPEPPPSDCPIGNFVVDQFNWWAKQFGRKSRIPHAVVPELIMTPTEVNLVDGAIGKPNSPDLVDPKILNIGIVDEWVEAFVGMKIKKQGRTSGLNHGSVALTAATVDIQYGRGVLTLELQGVTNEPMALGGDSGSQITTDVENAKAVGPLCAGSDKLTIFNLFRHYKEAFELD